MRYLKAEHEAFSAAIKNSGSELDAFSFTKRKGWLIISGPGFQIRYHRKEKSDIDSDGRFISSTEYMLEHGGERSTFNSFDTLIDHLSRLLDSFNSHSRT